MATADAGRADHLPQSPRVVGTAGPTVSLLGGVHGDELEGVLAVRAVAFELSRIPLRGTVRWAAPAHPAAWDANSRLSPDDGLNLARVFPGAAHGSPTERVAAHLTNTLIEGSNLLIDLHSAGRSFDMPLLCGFHSEGRLAGQAAAAAAAFAAPLTWRHPESGSGRSLSAAEDLGIPSIYVEGRGGGQIRLDDLHAYRDGMLRVLAHLGMIDHAPPAGPTLVVTGDGNTDEGMTAPCPGYFVMACDVGDRLSSGQLIGSILDDNAQTLVDIVADQGGVVMLLRRGARVAAGDTLAIVGNREGPYLS